MSRSDQSAQAFPDLSERACEYYQDCADPAVYAVPVERLGDGEREVVACQDCAVGHADGPGRSMDDLRDLDASERWQSERGEVDGLAILWALVFVASTVLGSWALAALVVGGGLA